MLKGIAKKDIAGLKEPIDYTALCKLAADFSDGIIPVSYTHLDVYKRQDKNLAEANSLSKSIGQLMKEGKKEEAEAAKSRVAELKEVNKGMV